MLATYPRDRAMTAFILGFFGSAWFSWAQDAPPDTWLDPLNAGAILGLVIAVSGAGLAWRLRHGPSALHAPGAMPRFGRIVGIEFVTASGGALALIALGQPALIAPWVGVIVGLHFWPLAAVLRDPSLRAFALALVISAVVGLLVARQTGLAPSAVVGAAAGGILLLAAGGALARSLAPAG